MDVNNKDEAIKVVPPAYRKDAKITQFKKFKQEEVVELLKHQDA
jgi:hypothetical protein